MPRWTHVMPRTPLTGLLLLVATGIAAAADQPSPQGLDFFERKIRPVLRTPDKTYAGHTPVRTAIRKQMADAASAFHAF